MRIYGTILAALGLLSAFAADKTIDDIRVDALVKSRWDQLYAGGAIAWGAKCYNYHTPTNNNPSTYYLRPKEMHCGCVATALAQVMRYHEWPKTAVEAKTYTCKVYDKNYTEDPMANCLRPTELTMKGGVYDWSMMPYETTYETPEDQREMIGRLCYDAGVSISAIYDNGMTAAGAYSAIHSFPNNFHYASSESIFWNYTTNMKTFDAAEAQKMIVPSLDAGLPCVFTIYGKMGGHTVVCDGYGFHQGEFRVHINGGYSGAGDGWHSLTNYTGIGGYNYDSLNGINFNIAPTNTGAIASGRVVDASGQPVARAWMTIRKNGVTHKTMYTNARGIYFFWGDPGTYDVIASKDGIVRSTRATLTKPQSINVGQDGSYYMNYATVNVGNSPYNDILLSASDERVAKPTASVPSPHAFSGTTTVELSCATEDATIRYTLDGTMPTVLSPVYTKPIALSSSATIRAVGMKSGVRTSAMMTVDCIESTLAGAIECPGLSWKTGGEGTWTVRTEADGADETADGEDSLRSPDFPAGQAIGTKTWLETEIDGPATLSFKYKYEPWYYAPFSVEVDGTAEGYFSVTNYSGYGAKWETASVAIPEGRHTLRFVYWYRLWGKQNATFDGIHLDQVTYAYTGPEIPEAGADEDESELLPDPEPEEPGTSPDPDVPSPDPDVPNPEPEPTDDPWRIAETLPGALDLSGWTESGDATKNITFDLGADDTQEVVGVAQGAGKGYGLVVTSGTLNFTASGGTTSFAGRQVTADGPDAVLRLAVGDATGWGTGGTGIALRNGGTLAIAARDTLKTPLQLDSGHIVLEENCAEGGRALDLFAGSVGNSWTVTGGKSTVVARGTGANRKIYLRDGDWNISVAEGATLVIDADLVTDNVFGASGTPGRLVKSGAGDLVILGTSGAPVVYRGTDNLTGAYRREGEEVALDAAGAVVVGGETVSVTPELASKPGDAEIGDRPFAVTSESVAVGVKAIPGLRYTLLRGETPQAVTSGCASETARESRVKLTDSDPSPDKAFYRVRVE